MALVVRFKIRKIPSNYATKAYTRKLGVKQTYRSKQAKKTNLFCGKRTLEQNNEIKKTQGSANVQRYAIVNALFF